METPAYISILKEPLAFWIANCDADNVPEVVRCVGIRPVTSLEELTVFIPEIWSGRFLNNLSATKKITFLCTSVPTYESYQYKGEFRSVRPCEEADVQLQLNYLEGFTDEIAKIGLSKIGFFDSYHHQPMLAVTVCIDEVFDQSPYKGTGKQVNKQEAPHD